MGKDITTYQSQALPVKQEWTYASKNEAKHLSLPIAISIEFLLIPGHPPFL